MTTTAPPRPSPSVFALAAKVFDGWTNPDTGLRVLRLHTHATSADGYH